MQIPVVEYDDIQRIIKRDFPNKDLNLVEDILEMYRTENDKGRNRVFASILKLSNGDTKLAKTYVQKANYDYRDVIAKAEYPNYSAHAFDEDLPVELKQKLIESDWMQYQAWFNKA